MYWSEKEHRLLSFREVFTSHIEVAESQQHIESQGIKIVDNTPEEINDIVLEMLGQLENTLTYSPEDDRLQQCFRQLKPVFSSQFGTSLGRVGRDFLRKYAHLLS